jgi:pantothenate kinase
MDAAQLCTDELLARLVRLGPGRHILGITGAPGAGKSTLAAELVARLGPDAAVLIGMDGFHLDDEILRAHGSFDRKGAIDTFDGDGYAALLQRVAAARPGDPPIYAPRFDRSLEASLAGAVEIPSTVPLVVTEGNYLLADSGPWPRARAALDEVWFLDLDDETRRARLIARHRSYGRSDAEARQRALGSDETNAQLIAAARSRADLALRWRRD